FIAPKEMKVDRSIVIDAAPEKVYPYISTFEQTNRWQPWMQLDPNMETGIEGTDGTEGVKYWWRGNDEVGSGEQVVKNMVANEKVEVDLRFIEPWESEALAVTSLKAVEGGTQVNWGFSSPMPFPVNIMALFMTGSLEKDYDKGLSNLKALVEEELAQAPDVTYEVKTVDFPTKHLVTYRKEVPMTAIDAFIQEQMPKLGQAVISKNIEMKGTAMSLTYKWDEAEQITDASVAIPVDEGTDLGGEYQSVTIPAGKALVVDYYGAYEGSIVAHEAIDAYIKANNLSMSLPVIEEYVTDPSQEPDPSKWLTRVYYLIEG
ncbi:MAG: SRPBCC family protein, partial [Bacteroidota bacterium]